MPRTGKKARLTVAAVLATTASPEPNPRRLKGGNSGQHLRQLKSMTPAMTLLLDLFISQITTLTYVSQGFYVKIVVLRSSRDREAIE